MTTTASQQSALEKAVVREVYFAQFEFKSSTAYFSSFNQPIDWGGKTWSGLGGMASIGAVDESDGVESKALEFGLNAAEQAWLAVAAGSVEEYRGRPAKLYFSPLDENYRLIDTPILCWRGIMDAMTIGIDGESSEAKGQIMLRCETSAYGIKRQPALRMNDSQQRAKYPTDRGFEYLNGLLSEPQLWLSKRFQSV